MPEIELERRADGIAVLTLNAPERRTALTVAMAEALTAACQAIDADAAVGAVVVRGEGGYFCAGGDRPTLAAVPAQDSELARRTAASLRTVTGPPALPWAAALELERASQMWSMRRRADAPPR